MKQDMEKEGPKQFQIDSDMFKDLATKAGFDPKIQNNNPTLLDVKTKIEDQIAKEQSANKQHPNQTLPPERRKEIARYWFADVLTKEKHWYGDDTIEKHKRYEVQDVSKILRAIPPEHMGGIVAFLDMMNALQGRKQPVSLPDIIVKDRASQGRNKKPVTLSDLTKDEIIALEIQLYQKEP
jgi:hypothetical protein